MEGTGVSLARILRTLARKLPEEPGDGVEAVSRRRFKRLRNLGWALATCTLS